ncbi:MAG: archaeosortase A [Halobacteriota archaeon]
MDIFIVASIAAMLLFIFLKNRVVGGIAWAIFGVAWIIKVPYYISINDYFNATLVILAFLFFVALAITIVTSSKYMHVFVDVTAFSALAALVYFPFTFSTYLNQAIIELVAEQTVILANWLGIHMVRMGDTILLNDHRIQIILACTGIESVALFTGATLGIKSNSSSRKLKAFMISVPIIYILNLLRNIFVTMSFSYSWFGENSFYIAHHIVSKILATVALILISLGVFKILPELADLIFGLKEALADRWWH